METTYATKEDALAAGRLKDAHLDAYRVQMVNSLIDVLKARGAEVVEDGRECGRYSDPFVNGARLFEVIRLKTVNDRYSERNGVRTIEMRIDNYSRGAATFRRLKKDGSFDYDTMADAVLAEIESVKVAKARNKERQRLFGVSDKLSEDERFMSLPDGVRVIFETEVKVVVRFNPETEQENLLKLMEFIKTLKS